MKQHHDKGAWQKLEILNAAIDLAEEQNYYTLTRKQIADAAGVSPGLINWYFGSMNELKDEIIRWALRAKHKTIVAQAKALKHPLVCCGK